MISVCPSCSRQVNIGEDLIGREVKCPACSVVFRVGHGDRHEIVDSSRPMPERPFVDDQYAPSSANPLLGPAIGLLASACLAVLYGIVNAVGIAMMLGKEVKVGEWTITYGNAELAAASFMLFFSFLVLVGAVCLLTRRGYGFAWVGAVCGVMPCYYCFFLGIPFGIWAMILLTRDDVKRSFQAGGYRDRL